MRRLPSGKIFPNFVIGKGGSSAGYNSVKNALSNYCILYPDMIDFGQNSFCPGGYMQGKQKRLTEERLPPYLSYRAWQKLLGELCAHNPPSRFDPSYFDTLKISKSNRSMLKGALIFLGLMSTDGIPSPRLHQLVKAEGEAQRAALADMVRNAYKPLLADVNFSSATQAQVKEYFSSQGASGDIGRKCMSFFFAIANEAKIPLSPHLKKSASQEQGGKSAHAVLPRPRISKLMESGSSINWEAMLFDKFPDFNPGWPDDIQKKWFDAFFKFFKRASETSADKRKTPPRRR